LEEPKRYQELKNCLNKLVVLIYVVQLQEKIAPEELQQRVDCDYYGFRDEEDGLVLKYESEQQQFGI
jgi:hypothetical protein